MKTRILKLLLFNALAILWVLSGSSQTITGAWRGKIRDAKLELKLIKTGDSLRGTSYYFTSLRHYKRYSVKGYFDPETNDVIWWDDELLDIDGQPANVRNEGGNLSVADFNCPGEDRMKLEGNLSRKADRESRKEPLDMEKVAQPSFADEWDFVLANYFVGANDPKIIDSVSKIRSHVPVEDELPLAQAEKPLTERPTSAAPVKIDTMVTVEPAVIVPKADIASNENKFRTREKVLQTVIPVKGRNIELRFYDNAQIDGDSIAIFLNGKLIAEHIYLTDQAYTIKLDANDLANDNELVMVAENLGSIPPNTSFMVAIVGGKRFEARLFANEKSSALVRFVKPVSEE